MTEKNAILKSVLLVDDDQVTNYFHRLIIKYAILETIVTIAIDGKHTLEYILQGGIKLGRKNTLEIPHLIVLNLNMPRMGGLAFFIGSKWLT
jgi:CheY-like chemotaxis protein